MLASLPRLILVRLLGALLLAVVGLQAGAPMPAPLERTHGSAFSASTHEVALAAQRRDVAPRQVLAPQPAVPPASLLAANPLAPLPLRARQPALRPHSTAPPPAGILALGPAPRAPPFA